MGLFTREKKTCGICGKDLGLLGKRKLGDGCPHGGSMRRLLAPFALIVAFAFASCLIAVGCMGASVSRDDLIGTWDYDVDTVARFVGEDLTDEQLMAARQLMFLNLNEDGTADLVLFGESQSGAWKIGGAGVSIEIGGDEAPAKLEDGVLALGAGEAPLLFRKAKTTRAIPSSDEVADAMQALVGSGPESQADAVVAPPAAGAKIELDDFAEPTTVADDDFATVLVTASGTNALGDPGFNLRITNNGDAAVYLGLGEFTVGGAGVTAYGSEVFGPGETKDVFLAFDAADFEGPATPASLVDVHGVLTIIDDATTTALAHYDFAW